MTDTPRKTEFYWASIAGAEPEPVEVCTVDGRRACYTLGCPDPFFLDDPNSPVVLGSFQSNVKFGWSWKFFDPETPRPLERPPLDSTNEPARRRAEKEWNKMPHHSWRGPR